MSTTSALALIVQLLSRTNPVEDSYFALLVPDIRSLIYRYLATLVDCPQKSFICRNTTVFELCRITTNSEKLMQVCCAKCWPASYKVAAGLIIDREETERQIPILIARGELTKIPVYNVPTRTAIYKKGEKTLEEIADEEAQAVPMFADAPISRIIDREMEPDWAHKFQRKILDNVGPMRGIQLPPRQEWEIEEHAKQAYQHKRYRERESGKHWTSGENANYTKKMDERVVKRMGEIERAAEERAKKYQDIKEQLRRSEIGTFQPWELDARAKMWAEGRVEAWEAELEERWQRKKRYEQANNKARGKPCRYHQKFTVRCCPCLHASMAGENLAIDEAYRRAHSRVDNEKSDQERMDRMAVAREKDLERHHSDDEVHNLTESFIKSDKERRKRSQSPPARAPSPPKSDNNDDDGNVSQEEEPSVNIWYIK